MRILLDIVITIPFVVFGIGVYEDPPISVVARGMGVTAEAALRDSFRDAVGCAESVFVDAEQQVMQA